MTKIHNLTELAALVGAAHSTIESVARRIYKDTECGAWVDERKIGTTRPVPGIGIGSIVEGVDQATGTEELAFPFSDRQFWKAVQSVERQAEEIWNQTHGCPECWGGFGDEEETGSTPVDPDCKACHGQGEII
jgi:hypothetical protein